MSPKQSATRRLAVPDRRSKGRARCHTGAAAHTRLLKFQHMTTEKNQESSSSVAPATWQVCSSSCGEGRCAWRAGGSASPGQLCGQHWPETVMRDGTWGACAVGARTNQESAGQKGSGEQEPVGRRPEGNQSVWGRGDVRRGLRRTHEMQRLIWAGRAAVESDSRELTGRGQESMAGARGPSPGQRGLTKKAAPGRWEVPGGRRAAGTLQTVCSEGTVGQLKNGCEARSLKTEETWDRRHERDRDQPGTVLSVPVHRKPLCQRFAICSEAGFPEQHRKASVRQRPLPALSWLS